MIKEPTITGLLRWDRSGVPPQKLNGHITMEARGQVIPWESSRHKIGDTKIIITQLRRLGPAAVAAGAKVVVEKVKAARRTYQLRLQCSTLGNIHVFHVTLEVKVVRRQVTVGEVRSGPGRVGAQLPLGAAVLPKAQCRLRPRKKAPARAIDTLMACAHWASIANSFIARLQTKRLQGETHTRRPY